MLYYQMGEYVPTPELSNQNILSIIKSESKKIGHFLLLIIWYWEPSEYFWIKKGQNDLFQALKWGIVCLSTSNGSRDMTKRNNSLIWNFHDLV